MNTQTILVIEDAEDIRELLSFNLGKEGYKVLEASTGEQGLKLAQQHLPNLILLDVMLPGKDGYAVCKELATSPRTSGIPVIMLTARGDEVDRIVGFELGAVDYVVKPFSVRELGLRIRSVLKRLGTPPSTGLLQVGTLVLDRQTYSVSIDDNPINLTVTEFAILQDLMQHKGVVRTREQILLAAWGNHFDGYARTVDSHVKRLRSKLGDGAEFIETVRGIGYRLKENTHAV